ncbi:MAG: hypothetical protein DMG97_14100 [Acidobacteria bacterium]|nr:MAG: hypothetical protein DMG97_14100 [Acidobacteriota bacterium]
MLFPPLIAGRSEFTLSENVEHLGDRLTDDLTTRGNPHRVPGATVRVSSEMTISPVKFPPHATKLATV